MNAPKENTLFSYKTNVRIDDINFGNHLCHSKFINILHNTRALFLKKHNLSEANCFSCGLVILNLNIDYINPCFFDDILEISLSITEIKKSYFSMSYLIYNHTSTKIAAKATTLIGFLDLSKRKLKKIPIEFLKLFSPM